MNELKKQINKFTANKSPTMVYVSNKNKKENQQEIRNSLVDWFITQLIKDNCVITFDHAPEEKNNLEEKWYHPKVLYTSPADRTFKPIDSSFINKTIIKNAYELSDNQLFGYIESGTPLSEVSLSFALKDRLWALKNVAEVFEVGATYNDLIKYNENVVKDTYSICPIGTTLERFWRDNYRRIKELAEKIDSISFKVNDESKILTYNFFDTNGKVIKSRDKSVDDKEVQIQTISLFEALKQAMKDTKNIRHEEDFDPLTLAADTSYFDFLSGEDRDLLKWIIEVAQFAINEIEVKNPKENTWVFSKLKTIINESNFNYDNVLASMTGLTVGESKPLKTQKPQVLALPIRLNSKYPKGFIVNGNKFTYLRTLKGIKLVDNENESKIIDKAQITSSIKWGDIDETFEEIYNIKSDNELKEQLWLDLNDYNSLIWKEERFLSQMRHMFGNGALNALIGLSLVFLDRLDSSKIHHLLHIHGAGGTGKSLFIETISKWFSGKTYLENGEVISNERESDHKDLFSVVRDYSILYKDSNSFDLYTSCTVLVSETISGNLGKEIISKIKAHTGGDAMPVRQLYQESITTNEPALIMSIGNSPFIIPPGEEDSLGRRVNNIEVISPIIEEQLSFEELRETIYNADFFKSLTKYTYMIMDFINHPITINEKSTKQLIKLIIKENQSGETWSKKESMIALYREVQSIRELIINDMDLINKINATERKEMKVAIFYNMKEGYGGEKPVYETIFDRNNAIISGGIEFAGDANGNLLVSELYFKRDIMQAMFGVGKKEGLKIIKVIESASVYGRKEKPIKQMGNTWFSTYMKPNRDYATIIANDIDIRKRFNKLNKKAIDELNEFLLEGIENEENNN